MKNINVKEILLFVGVMMFLLGASALDSSLKVGGVLCLIGIVIGVIGEKFFY